LEGGAVITSVAVPPLANQYYQNNADHGRLSKWQAKGALKGACRYPPTGGVLENSQGFIKVFV